MGFNTKIYLVDIESVLDKETGKNKLEIVHETLAYADKQDVGLNEYYSAIGSNIKLTATFEIPAHLYHGEKYILSGDKKHQYEISRTAKGHTPSYIRLPVTAVSKKNHLVLGAKSG